MKTAIALVLCAVSAVAASTGLLTPDMAPGLWGAGAIPSVKHLDTKYAKSRAKDVCTVNYRALEGQQKDLKPTKIPKSLSDLQMAAAEFKISPQMVNKTLAVFLANQSLIPNQRLITIFDLSQPATDRRFVIVDMVTGIAKGYRSAHGMGSDPAHTGFARKFGNDPGGKTNESSLGCALTGKIYHASGTFQEPKGRLALTLLGFSPENDNMCSRHIFMHGAPYVDYQKDVPKSLKCYADKPGRSHGCPAFTYADRDDVFKQISGGVLVCSWNE